MQQLPRGLRWYLWAIYGACASLVVAQSFALPAFASGRHPSPIGPLAVAVFMLLAYAGERATLQVSAYVDLSLATPVHVCAILLFPPPFPVLITLVAVVADQARRADLPAYKRFFNICHAPLTVGLSGLLVSFVAAPVGLLRPGHVIAAIPALALLMALYYLLDVGLLTGVFSLLERRSPATIWWDTSRPTALAELATSAIGILGAVAWSYDPVLWILFLLPAVSMREAFRASARAEQARAVAEESQTQAEQALHVRDEFLTAASHDLRTPLTGVVGFADLILMRLERTEGVDSAWLATQIAALRHAAGRMATTVEEITDAAQLQIGQPLTLKLDYVPVSDMVRMAASVVRSGSPTGSAPVIIDTAPAVTIKGDRLRLERVVQNVIGNAVKYSPANKPVHVAIVPAAEHVAIVVRDEGVGIPAEELPHIFTHFYRASTARGIKGTGVGLAGALNIVQQHGGDIHIDSAVGHGTTVTIDLPMTPPAA